MPYKYCRKFEQTDDRQMTDGQATAYSERECEFTFANNHLLLTADMDRK